MDIVLQACSLLSSQEIACTVRLVCKDLARHFSAPHHRTVRLSQPVPPHAFAARFGRGSATGALEACSTARKVQLVALTAGSGSIENLETLRRRAGGKLWGPSDFCGASCGASLSTCDRLALPGPATTASPTATTASSTCASNETDPYAAAARHGHLHVIRWLASQGHPVDPFALLATVVRHRGLADTQWLLQQPPFTDAEQLTPGITRTLLQAAAGAEVLAAAAASTTPDTLAKLQWLLDEHGAAAHGGHAAEAAARHDRLDALLWLQQRGCKASQSVLLSAAADGGALQVMEHLLARHHFQSLSLHLACSAAAAAGQLPALRSLLPRALQACVEEAGNDAALRTQLLVRLYRGCMEAAVRRGRWGVLRVLAAEHGVRLPVEAWALVAAAPDEPTLRWLWEGAGGQPGQGVADALLARAVRRCCLPAMAFLVDEAGARLAAVPQPAFGGALVAAAASGSAAHLAALAWLHARRAFGLAMAAHEQHTLLTVLRHGNLELVAWMYEHWVLAPGRVRRGGGGMLAAAADSGCVALVAWLLARGCSLASEPGLCARLATGSQPGDHEVVRLLRRALAWEAWRPALALALCLGVQGALVWGSR